MPDVGEWAWWRHPREALAHVGQQGGSGDALCGLFLLGATPVGAMEATDARDPKAFCTLCRARYALPDHGSDRVRLERERDEARAERDAARAEVERLRAAAEALIAAETCDDIGPSRERRITAAREALVLALWSGRTP
jgi:hypothetical protein